MRLFLLRLALPLTVFAAAILMTSCDPGTPSHTHHHTTVHTPSKKPSKTPDKVYKAKPRRR